MSSWIKIYKENKYANDFKYIYIYKVLDGAVKYIDNLDSDK